MTVVEHIKGLVFSLTKEQREELTDYLNRPNGNQKPVLISLRGSWEGKFPEDFDPTPVLREIRSEWKDRLGLDK